MLRWRGLDRFEDYEAMVRWRRPHGVSGFTMASGGALAAFGMLAFTGSMGVVTGRWPWHGSYLLLVLPIALVWRIMLIDLYVNGSGLRLRTLWHTRTIPWSEVAGFDTRPRTWLGEPGSLPAIWIDLRDSASIETPIVRASEVRMLFQRSGQIHVSLPEREFDECLATLRDRLVS